MKGSETNGVALKQYTWEEVSKHNKKGDRWLVVEGKVYNVTDWMYKHPGGRTILGHYSGQDASEAVKAFHKDLNYVGKFMRPLCIGELTTESKKENDTENYKKDFEQLRDTAKQMGLFTPSKFFYVVSVLHLFCFELSAAYIAYTYGLSSWTPYLLVVICLAITQSQAGWTQHDFGHLSVFQTIKANRVLHLLVMNVIKGASADWWNHLHYQHHCKPNVMGKDPDVRLEKVFVVGESMAKQVAENKNTVMPYNWQHRYFFAIGPPLLFPVYFQYMIFRHLITRRKWLDMSICLLYYIKFFSLYVPLLGLFGAWKLMLIIRVLESHWFVWVSQMNHIPMEVEVDQELPWLRLQLNATCNVVKSPFNDWFTGHLNFQIEHHLFPTMPRHNLYKIKPLVKSLCEKHHIPYQEKTLWRAFADIVSTLKSSGELWDHYYHAYHLS